MKRTFFAALLLLTAGFNARAATAEELDRLMKSGERLTVIDLRTSVYYQRSHLPGAINIPERIIADKKLPPLGRVVVYGDGLGDKTEVSVAALNAKPGIQAEALEGGFAGWETFSGITAVEHATGTGVPLPSITWQDLAGSKGEGILLVDSRLPETAPAAGTAKTGAAAAAKPRPKTNLTGLFNEVAPKASVTNSPFQPLSKLKGRRSTFAGAPWLIVIVDSDPVNAEKIAKRVLMAGYRRVAILAGGEEILLRKGKSGLARQGAAVPVTLDPAFTPPPVQKTPDPK